MSHSTVHIDAHFPFRIQAVWQAWTNPAIVKLWFGSDPNGTVDRAHLDARPGGEFEISFRNSNLARFTCRGMYEKVKCPTLLTFTWNWDNEPGEVSHVTVKLTANPSGGTNMAFTHADVLTGSTHDYKAGWSRTFEKMDRALAGA